MQPHEDMVFSRLF